ncbi:hypothetical protein TNCV_2447781 [Trichonephila clavipes]|uniref:Uncharacterized protein n=1 Tax=Trichonephila clavipes TaxID=2585209 RepID=A0A8X6SEW9_TRICX|nr:hypothetical protein TNCV_2447781 [Trichonephila clavipes]
MIRAVIFLEVSAAPINRSTNRNQLKLTFLLATYLLGNVLKSSRVRSGECDITVVFARKSETRRDLCARALPCENTHDWSQ